MRYLLIVGRGILLKGVGPDVLWPQMLALALLGWAGPWLTSTRFHEALA